MIRILVALSSFLICLPTTFSANDTLIFVQTLSRHGARSPIKTYPHDNYNESQWFQGYGYLTQKGMHGALELGDFLKKRYVESHALLSSQYDHKEVYVRSTDVDRTLLTATLSMQSLFPSTQPLNPVPIHTMPIHSDRMLYSEDCVVFNERVKDNYTRDEVKKKTNIFEELFAYLQTHLDFSPMPFSQMGEIADNLKCKAYNNFTLPAWATGNDSLAYRQLMQYIDASFEVTYNRYDNARLKAGLLLGDIVKSLELKAKGALDRRAHFYYAHDTTLAPLLAALKVYNNLQPPFASTTLIELYKNSKNNNNNKDESNLADNKNNHNNNEGSDKQDESFYVKVLYRNDSLVEPLPLELPGCQVNCPLEQFIELTKGNVVDDWEKVCLKEKKIPLHDVLLLVTSLSLLLAIIIILVCSIVACRRRGPYHRYVDVPTEDE